MPETQELTGPQIVRGAVFDSELTFTQPATYATYRTIRLDPTIAFVRAVRIAIVAAGEWSIEADDDADDAMVEYARDMLLPMRELIYNSTMAGGVDYGWAPFEKVFAIGDDGRVKLAKLKPLLHDLTTILANKNTGAFTGFKQESVDGNNVFLPIENSFLVSFGVEGTNWYGTSLLENARKTMVRYDNTDKAAARYDRKVAGALIIVHHPEGKSKNAQGVMTANSEIAATIGREAQSSGVMTIPSVTIEKAGEAEIEQFNRWKVELLSDSAAAQTQFVQRMEYLDTQKARALLMAERSVLEGKHGTKAEAGEHMGAVVTILESEDRHVTRHVNWHILDQLLAQNWGQQARGKVKFVAAPLRDEGLKILNDVYQTILKNPSGFSEEFGHLDRAALADRLGVPRSEEAADPLEIDEGELDEEESERVTEVAGAPGETQNG